MQDALKRLRALQQQLENLHRTTARVLAESEQLIGAIEAPAPGVVVPSRVARVARPKPSKPSARPARKRSR